MVPSGKMPELRLGGSLRTEAGGGVAMGKGSIRASMSPESWCEHQQSAVTQEETTAAAGRKKQARGLQRKPTSCGKVLNQDSGGGRKSWKGRKGLETLDGGILL